MIKVQLQSFFTKSYRGSSNNADSNCGFTIVRLTIWSQIFDFFVKLVRFLTIVQFLVQFRIAQCIFYKLKLVQQSSSGAMLEDVYVQGVLE